MQTWLPKMKAIQTILLALLLASCGQEAKEPAYKYVEPWWLIEPGISIGLIRVGMNMEDAKWLIGKVYGGVKEDEYGACNKYGDLCARGRDKVVIVSTSSEVFRTKEGLHVESMVSEFVAAFGKPTSEIKDRQSYQAFWDNPKMRIAASRGLELLGDGAPVDSVWIFGSGY